MSKQFINRHFILSCQNLRNCDLQTQNFIFLARNFENDVYESFSPIQSHRRTSSAINNVVSSYKDVSTRERIPRNIWAKYLQSTHLKDPTVRTRQLSRYSGNDWILSRDLYFDAVRLSHKNDYKLVLPKSTVGICIQPSLLRHAVSNNSSCSNFFATAESTAKENEANNGKPSEQQLEAIFSRLGEYLPKIFVQSLDYSIFHTDIVVENNIRGNRTVGLYNLIKLVALMRTVAHLKFAYVRFETLKMTKHPEDGTVKVRWRIRGLSGLKIMINFWKYKLWKLKEVYDQQELWYDGFTTFHVGSDGKIFHIVIDKVIPDNNEERLQKNSTVAQKLAILFGLLSPTESNSY